MKKQFIIFIILFSLSTTNCFAYDAIYLAPQQPIFIDYTPRVFGEVTAVKKETLWDKLFYFPLKVFIYPVINGFHFNIQFKF